MLEIISPKSRAREGKCFREKEEGVREKKLERERDGERKERNRESRLAEAISLFRGASTNTFYLLSEQEYICSVRQDWKAVCDSSPS